MTRRVELYGPEGAGKTTLYETVGRLRDASSPEFHLIHELRNKHNTTMKNRADLERIGLEDFFGQDVFRTERFQQRYLPAIKRRLRLVDHLHDVERNATILEDEGLLQRGLNVGQADQVKDSTICEYYRKVPAPVGVVIVSTDAGELMKRNVERGLGDRQLNRGKGMLLSLHIVDLAGRVLAERGVPILHIDSRIDSAANALSIFKFITGFSGREDRPSSAARVGRSD